MFERFTERARQVVVLAQDEARALGHGYIGTEHLLLGILREEEGLGRAVLASLGVTVVEVRDRVARIVGRGDEIPTGQIAFTPHAKRALELSLQRSPVARPQLTSAPSTSCSGSSRDNQGVASQVLLELGVRRRDDPRPASSACSPDHSFVARADVAYQRAFV